MIPCEPELGVLSLGRWNMLAVVFWLLLLKIVTSGIKRGAISIWTFQRVTTSGYDLTTSTRDWMYPSIFTSPRLTHCNRVRYSLREVNLVLIMGEEMIEGWGGSFTAAKGKSWRKSFLESEWHCGGPSSVHGQTRGELISQPKLPEMVRVIARNRTVLDFDWQNLILSPYLFEETEVFLQIIHAKSRCYKFTQWTSLFSCHQEICWISNYRRVLLYVLAVYFADFIESAQGFLINN